MEWEDFSKKVTMEFSPVNKIRAQMGPIKSRTPKIDMREFSIEFVFFFWMKD